MIYQPFPRKFSSSFPLFLSFFFLIKSIISCGPRVIISYPSENFPLATTRLRFFFLIFLCARARADVNYFIVIHNFAMLIMHVYSFQVIIGVYRTYCIYVYKKSWSCAQRNILLYDYTHICL